MFKKIILVLIGGIFFSGFNLAYAGLVINEIMYDLSGSDTTSSKSREWIEIYNPDASDVSIDASKWRIYDGSANRTINGEVNFSISAGDYVIFAGDKDTFLADHSDFGGVVYDTGITSLNNTGATLKILDQDGNTIDLVTYASTQGAIGDGNSLQKTSGSWISAMPTPGKANETVASPTPPIDDSGDDSNDSEDTNTSTSSSSSTTSKSSSATKKVTTSKIKTEIISKSLAYAGIPLLFQGRAFEADGKQAYHGKYFWNFGDGDSREVKIINTDKFNHVYFYPGEYTVSLDYFPDAFAEVPDASDSIVIKVVAPGVSISVVGNEKDFFVELSNINDYDVDVSRFLLASDYRTFKIPAGTILKSKKKMIISPRLTNLSIVDKNSLKLMTSEGELVFDYPASLNPIVTPQNTARNRVGTARIFSPIPSSGIENDIPLIEEETLTENLSASALSGVPYIPAVASIVLVGASLGAVYFIRKKKVTPKAGDDFDILDE